MQTALELGENINAVGAKGETAMHDAAYQNLPGAVQFLADRGANIQVWDQKNRMLDAFVDRARAPRFWGAVGSLSSSPRSLV